MLSAKKDSSYFIFSIWVIRLGGADARPFIIHHNTLDIDLYLCVAPELYLKRLTVGGFDRVYEINRNFRNEGISTQHNPEFTMLEFYEAYSNYRDLMDMNEQLFALLVKNITGSTTVKYGAHELDFTRFQRLSMRQAIVKCWPAAANGFSELNDPAEPERRFLQQMAQGGEDVPKQLDVDYLRALCHGLPPTAGEGIGIDRLTMLLTDSHSIRDVILFPLLRPEAKAEVQSASGSEKP